MRYKFVNKPFNILLSIGNPSELSFFEDFDCPPAESLGIKNFFNFTITSFTEQVTHDISANELALFLLGLVNDLLRADPVNERHEAIIIEAKGIFHLVQSRVRSQAQVTNDALSQCIRGGF